MPALLKFLVLLAIFLSASHAYAFVSLSSAAGNQVQVNHLTRLQQPMSDPTNEPSREPIREPTKRLGQDALLPVNLSSTGGLCHDKKSERVMFSNQGQNNEIQSDSTDSSNTQPSNWQGPKQRSLVISARVPFATFCSNMSSGMLIVVSFEYLYNCRLLLWIHHCFYLSHCCCCYCVVITAAQFHWLDDMNVGNIAQKIYRRRWWRGKQEVTFEGRGEKW